MIYAANSCIAVEQTSKHNYEHHIFIGRVRYTEWKYVSGVFYIDYDYKKARLQERKRTEEVIHECVCGESTIYTNSCLENRVVYVN